MTAVEKLALFACGIFFLSGLLTGIWKYVLMARSRDHQAPYYVNVAHRASLLYSFGALVLLKFLEFSPYSETVNTLAVAFPILFFGLAILKYIMHGMSGDTDNQFKPPYRLGWFRLAPWVFHLLVWLLIISEVGGFLVLFAGFVSTQLLR